MKVQLRYKSIIIWLLFLFLLETTLSQVQEHESQIDSHNEQSKEGYSNAWNTSVYSYHQTSSSRKSGVKGTKTSGVKGKPEQSITYEDITFEGGCTSRPVKPQNSKLYCLSYSGCRITCHQDYRFPTGETQIYMKCVAGEWQIENTEWEVAPHCEPICEPPCNNGGMCVAPHQCKCPQNYGGVLCEHERMPCLNYPPLPTNSRRVCNKRTCTVMCAEGYRFPDGSAVTNMLCSGGNWVPSRKDWTSIPNCDAVCEPACENGGVCLTADFCQCPQGFRGPRCQYSDDACTVGKLKFNGGYKCTGSAETLTCSISCPTGTTFEYPPVDSYVCHYSDGFFTPEPPQCIFPGNDVEMIPGSQEIHRISSSSSSTHGHVSSVHRVNVTWSDISSSWSTSNSWSSSSHHRFGSNSYRPSPGFCYSWGEDHYKTFDGMILSFKSDCSYTLVHDVVDNTFSITVEIKKNHKNIVLFLLDKKYILALNDQGVPMLTVGPRQFSIPVRLSGITVDFLSHFIELTATTLGVTVLWDEKNFISVNVMENMWNKTVGLCGRLDGYIDNDMEAKYGSVPRRLTAFVDSWKSDSLGEVCQSAVSEEHPCNSPTGNAYHLGEEATQFCSVLHTDPQFSACKNILNAEMYFEACKWDYCSCSSTDPSTCACESLSVYARECKRLGTDYIGNWRNSSNCPITCSGGRVYQPCGPIVQQTCSSTSDEVPVKSEKCEEGCYCPEGTVLHEGKCIPKSECPCQLRGKSFSPGESVPKECNTCTCVNGQWICTQAHCTARCSAVGDPHYITFDGRHFDFMGKCSYYLIKGDNFSVETENIACAGSVSQVLGFVGTSVTSYPSCTKTVTIRIGERFIKLKQNKEVSVNGLDIAHMPFTMDGATIRVGSSIFLIVELPNGLELFWDGFSRIFIDAPASLQGATKGLCGTFNLNQKDDFLTPEGDIEQSPVSFANKWKTQEVCEDTVNKVSDHPCDINIHNKATAEKYCSKLKGLLFQDCHWSVNYETYYEDCQYDLCSCEGEIGQCLCPILAAYAKECSDKGVIVDFRSDVLECAVSCPASQKYQVCGNSCTRSCYDITHNTQCKRQCVEGCNCIEGQTLDSNGECIPIEQCPCQSNSIEYPAGHKEIRPGSKGLQLCVCRNALWNCKLATYNEIEQYPVSGNVSCSAARNEELTVCEPEEPITCKNMHNPPQSSSAVCTPGCKCKKGFVLDIQTKKCILPKECPCHHGGKSYTEGSSIQEDCNTCECKAGMWKCTDKPCAAICTAWGDSHFKTFDGKIYDFQGTCDYVLAKGNLGNNDVFDISIYNVPCGTSGVTCSKSVTVKIAAGEKQEVITFTRDEPLPSFVGFDRITIREAGLFVFVDMYDMKLTLQWDRATRLYVKIDPQWKNKVKGLCGNYNDNDMDDFQTPSGGISEVSPVLFGDSWKLQPQCPNSMDIKDTCLQHPNKKVWALQKCGILKSSVFQPCHSEVPVEPYLERCIFDSCACDFGGDCECLCTAIAAYAQECNIHGVPIKWRSQELCPIQCDESCSHYSPCIKTCPKLTCDNHLIYKGITSSCHEDSCVEGCNVEPCPSGEVYFNLTTLKCVPLNECPSLCLQIDNVIYKEGDIIEQDACHTCHCSRNRKICQGKPCPEVSILTTTPAPVQGGSLCRSGWSSWINSNVPGNSNVENEPPPSVDNLFNLKSPGVCKEEDMTSIECREVGTHLSYEHYKDKEYNVTCSLEMNGLQCWGVCPDFEIRVFCSCVGSEIPTTEVQTTPSKSVRYYDTTVHTTPYDESSTTIKPVVTTKRPPLPIHCDIMRPNYPHPNDCYIFYQCVPTPTGSQYVEKTCGPSMMYNPNTMTCDWIQTVMAMRPECGRCPPGTFWSDCAYQCNQLCHHFEHESKQKGHCKSNHDCISGCIQSNCPQGHLWRDESTCVSLDDCTCMSKEGNVAKPGLVIHEDLYPCEICQCLSNSYICDNSTLCTTLQRTTLSPTTLTTSSTIKTTLEPTKPYEVTIPSVSSTTVIIIPSTVTPPPVCETEYVPLLSGPHAIKSVSLDASSSLNSYFSPENAIGKNITSSSAGSWTAAHQNQDQYLQVNLGEVDLIYGVVVRGSPLVDQYVTTYKLLYSLKGDRYTYVTDENNTPQVFRGPINSNDPAQQLLHHPVEAQYIRFNPQTWNEAISMRVELLGCGDDIVSVTTSQSVTTHRTTTQISECTEKMGLETGAVADQQISASSSLKVKGLSYEPSGARLSQTHYPGGWAPNIASENEWIQVNFVELRNLSGIVTQGQSHGDSWVEAYKVMYGNDGKVWNPVLDISGNKKIFSANFDSETVHTNMFDRTIRAQFIRIIPVVWHNYPVLRFDVLGCYEPYPTLPPLYTQQVTTESTPLPVKCNLCPSLPHHLVDVDKCRLCEESEWWDGEKCTSRVECPCFINQIKYMVGAVFFSEDCEECRCELHGIAKCESRHACAHCDKGLQSVLTPSCACICKPCPTNTILCPTTNICINESSWCDGIEDCPDDELNCVTETTTQTSTTTTFKPTQPVEVTCPPQECPPGYEVHEIPKDKYANLEPMNDAPAKQPSGIKGRPRKTPVKGRTAIKGRNGVKGQLQHGKPRNTVRCVTKYECVPPPNEKNCSKPTCPEGYTITPVKHEEGIKTHCVEYICKPPAAVCEISGRTFNTFDKTEYKYDACDHVLVRDRDDLLWEIVLVKNCSNGISCSQQLAILDDEHEITFYSDLSIKFDGYDYTAQQVERIGSQYSSFSLSQLGDSLYYESQLYGFRIKWDKESNIKIWVNGELAGHIDGLCGFFNGRREDDKLKPDGSSARTSVEFGDSWRNPRLPLACKVTQCPTAIQSQALEMCSSVRNKPLSLCQHVVKTEKFLSECIDFACSCLGTEESSEDECRCRVMQNYVTQCQAANQSVDVPSWRTHLNCPIFCPQPLVYRECYKHKCETSCENLREENPCPLVDNVCFPGCYCPDGLVRKGSSCVKPTECRDCICNGFGGSQYMSFDRSNFTFSGNCTYIAAQDKSQNEHHDFQVLVTNTECKHGPSSMCTTSITVIFENHTIHIQHDKDNEQLNFSLDQSDIEEFPYYVGWLQVEGNRNEKLTLLIPKIQLEVSYVYSTYALTIQLPSQLYGGKTEGLCGDCNYDQANDFSSTNDIVEPDINDFGNSWLYPSSINQKCGTIEQPPSCIVPSEENFCDKLLDLERFGKCHYIVDTDSYIQACHNDVCNSPDPIETACNILSAYASECLREGVCLDWRSDKFCPYSCHSGLEYHPCKIGCTLTCENYESLQNNPEKCHLNPTEGCFCPKGQILVNGTCINESHCKVCDDEGHHSGDTWYPDACTTCTCNGDLRQCNKVECISPDRICDHSMMPVLIKGTEQQCCPEYTCVPVSTTYSTPATCPEIKKPDCKPDQTLKLITQDNGCHVYVCECKAKDDCELLMEDEPVLPPGMVRVRNESGCCPHYNTLCDISRCPTLPPCKKFYKLVTKPPGINECCPVTTCEPPEDVCLYEFSYEAAKKGGEKERDVTDKFTVSKEPGSEWTDGPCRKCVCSGNAPGSYEVACSVESCITNNLSEEIKDYVLQEMYTHNHCCPRIVRLRCRDGENIYQANKKWSAHHDPCQTFICAEMPDGSVKKETMVKVCDETCAVGYFYESPASSSNECCGHCKQVACVVDGIVHAQNSEWETEDHCTKYQCLPVNNSLQVQGTVVNCPKISDHDVKDYEVQEISIADQCCKQHKKVKCKEGSSIYEIGTTWTSVNDSCLNISCVADESSGQAQKVETFTKCIEECDKGWEYIPSQPNSYECCGKCVQVACVDDFGHLHKAGEIWKENCTSYECRQHLTQFQIISMHETCPSVEDCPKDQLYPEKCCWKCNATTGVSRRNCQPEQLPEEMTVNLVYHHEKSHGNCTNLWPIENFNECRGNCESFTYYDPSTVHHESNCKCCQATQFQTLTASLTCEDGHILKKHISVPSECSCKSCGVDQETTNDYSQQHTLNEVSPEVDFQSVKGADQ